MKKVLLLGGAGFIGRGVCDYLMNKKKYEITIADTNIKKRDPLFLDKLKLNNVKTIESDFTNANSFDQLSSSYDYVYMLASIVGVNKCIQDPHEVIKVNTALIQNSLEWITNNKIGKVLFSSSSECYASTTDSFSYEVPTNEKVPLSVSDISHPRFTYAVTKMLGESSFLTYGKNIRSRQLLSDIKIYLDPRWGLIM